MTDSGPNREQSVFDRALVASGLANGDRPLVSWLDKDLGHISLRYGAVERRDEPVRYYELNQVGLETPDGIYPARRYVFEESGSLVGVVDSELIVGERGEVVNVREVEGAIDFQLGNGLWHPSAIDDTKLDTVLSSGVDNPTLVEVRADGADG